MPWITTKNGKHINTDWLDKDRQISANKKDADRLNKSDNSSYNNPLDLRNKIKDKWYTEKATKRAREYYGLMMEDLKNSKGIPINLTDDKAISKYCYEFIKKQQHISGFKGKPLCHDIAGAAAAILDYYGVDYECCNGFASGNPADSKSIIYTNHTWTYSPTLNKTYEYFEGHSNIYHHNIVSNITFK